ncbi:hypothetical protein [Oceanidesulfovibrio marinus]|uniref:HTH luxR-type domain-containing protein n=1 Tax=Oceanidesulfovibrio marinus TaxID=370038 RepID=A0A6P1ZGA6_9BACT|nr:hypothetical protein [Oceanidesulfovibrio marinus]QJT09589.1 hypothetical protein E8L03_11870 [Oceanidesulfovibrio marinus]TVM33800.1 hypothetical protein DQK91_11340 [Oceanidesulfovibrio marinus]
MAPKNKYVGNAKLPQGSFTKLLRLYAMDMEASRIAGELGYSRNTVNTYLRRLRERILEESINPAISPDGEAPGVFFMVRARGNSARSRKARRAFIFGRVRGERRVCVDIFKGREAEVLPTLLTGELRIEGQVLEKCWQCFSEVRGGELALHTVDTGLPTGKAAAALVAEFLETTRLRLEKFRGIKHGHVRLHIKECEFRFNHVDDVEAALLEMLSARPL